MKWKKDEPTVGQAFDAIKKIVDVKGQSGVMNATLLS